MRYVHACAALVASAALASCGQQAPPAASAPAGEVTPSVAQSQAPVAPSPTAVPEVAAQQPPEPVSSGPSRVGEVVVVGDWEVRVTKFEPNVNALLASINRFNPKPTNQWVMVTLEGKYTGTERRASIRNDLTWTFETRSGEIYEEPLPAPVQPAYDERWPVEARKGGTARWQVLFDVPAKAIKGGMLTVESLYDDDLYADIAIS